MLMDLCLPKFDICQVAVAPNCFKSHRNFECPDFFQKKKKKLPDARSETHLVQRNIFFT